MNFDPKQWGVSLDIQQGSSNLLWTHACCRSQVILVLSILENRIYFTPNPNQDIF